MFINQSPIDITSGNAVGQVLPALIVEGLWDPCRLSTVINTGQYLVIKVAAEGYLCGGGLVGTFQFHECQIKWGLGNNCGSEHSIDGERFSAELQFFFNKPTIDDEVAALCVFLKVVDRAPNYALFTFLSRVKEPGSIIAIDGNILLDFSCAITPFDFYSYKGSATVHPFRDNVTWFVYNHALPIKETQLQAIRGIHGHAGPISDNCRPQQDLGGRTILEPAREDSCGELPILSAVASSKLSD